MSNEYLAGSDLKGNLYLEKATQVSAKSANSPRVLVKETVAFQSVGPKGCFVMHDGSEVTIEYVNPGANDATLSLTVTGRAFKVNLATGPAGAVTTTANDIIALFAANEEANYLLSLALKTDDPSGNTGLGAVAAMYNGSPGTGVALSGGTPGALTTSVAGNNNDIVYTVRTAFAGPWGSVQAVGGNAVITFTTTSDSGSVTIASQTITNGILYHIPMSTVTRVSGTALLFYA